jgi:hypothetical protein
MELEHVDIFDIFHALQFAVDKITKKYYDKDDCVPKFIISQFDKRNTEGKVIEHEILLTVEHAGQIRTKTLFPRLDYQFGYESLKDEMMWLYNATM